MSNEHFDAELVATEYANLYPEKDYHDIQQAVIYGAMTYAKHVFRQTGANSNLIELDKVEQAIKEYYNALHSWEDANPLKLITQIKQLNNKI